MKASPLSRRDADLLARIASGDRHAFAEFYERHCAAACSLARRVCGRRDLADDAVQEAFCALWRDASSYRPELGAPRAWLLTIVRNRGVDAVRRRAAVERRLAFGEDLLNSLSDSEPPLDEALVDDERDGLLAGAISRLPAGQQQVIRLAYFDGLTHCEIAARLNLPLGTVKGRFRLAFRRLGGEPALAASAGPAELCVSVGSRAITVTTTNRHRA